MEQEKGVAEMKHMDLHQIRESERKSHEELYTSEELYREGSWLSKPIKTIMDLIPYFEGKKEFRALDLGCGVGRNSIFLAEQFRHADCRVDCVDILNIAIEKLLINAEKHSVSEQIKGYVTPIEDFAIEKNSYDLIMAVSALEHIDSEVSFAKKLKEICRGVREDGMVCLVINSEVRECEKETGKERPAQFEVNMETEKLRNLLDETFAGWTIVKSTVREQEYEIPREWGVSVLNTRVVTLVAGKCEKNGLQECIYRVKKMEQYLNEILKLRQGNKISIPQNSEYAIKWQELLQYYESSLWLRDFERDEKGELPEDLPCGVLSEDTLWNLICEVEEEKYE